jgi:hypothetical protein
LSFSDQPSLTIGQKLGCAVYGLIGVTFTVFGIMLGALGHCAPNEDGTGCENDALMKFLFYPVIPILFIVGGIILAWWMMRRRN